MFRLKKDKLPLSLSRIAVSALTTSLTSTLTIGSLLAVFVAVKNRERLFRSATRLYLHTVYAGLISSGMGRTIVTYDPEILKLDRIVLVANHVSVFDWLIVWLAMERLGDYNVVICAKRMNGLLRPFNLMMRILGFPVIQQRLDDDYITISRALRPLVNNPKYCFVIFPEGKLLNAVLSPSISDPKPPTSISAVDRLPTVLPIKTRGFSIAMDALKDTVDGVVDCTLVYDDRNQLVMPGPSHCVLRRVYPPADYLVDHHDVMADWLTELFERKKTIIRQIQSSASVNGDVGVLKLPSSIIKYPRTLEYDTRLLKLLGVVLRQKWLGFGVLFTAMVTALKRSHREVQRN